MAELADAADSKSAGLRPLGVRFPLPAPCKEFSKRQGHSADKSERWDVRGRWIRESMDSRIDLRPAAGGIPTRIGGRVGTPLAGDSPSVLLPLPVGSNMGRMRDKHLTS